MPVARNAIAASCGAACVLAMFAAPAASATPVDEGVDTDTFSFLERNFCDVAGLDVMVEGTFEYRFRAHRQGADGVVYYVNHAEQHTTYTNVDTGEYLVETVRFLEKDQKIAVDEDTLTITVLATGPSTVKYPNGAVVVSNSGQIRYQVLIDHNGTPNDPFDDELIADLGIVRESTGTNEDFCEGVGPALR